MPFSNYIYEYYDGVSSGNITVGKWVRLLYEYIVKGLQEGLFTFNAKKANKAIRFIETFCHHCEGRTDLLKLELWQKAAVSVMFGIVEEDGTRVFREVFIVIGRKNGKTLLRPLSLRTWRILTANTARKYIALRRSWSKRTLFTIISIR